MNEELDTLLSKYYYDVGGPAAYASAEKLYHIVNADAQNELHANYAERVLQTIKNKMFRFFTKNRTHKYINNLQNFAKSYNGTPHRSLQNIAPKDVNSVNESDIWGKMYLSKTEKKPKEIKVQTNKKKRRKKQFKYKIGSLVRLSNIAHIFDRSYSQRWTEEIFKVVQRFRQQNIDLYRLSNIKGDEFIRGTFYDSELQRVEKDENSLWIIEKIIKKRKRRGKN
ncbi:unnamed protein product [Mytilus edulis]|uniref:Integrase catalytic domain-containing protein n=1 Tax=Mytilus edulis TaxID=6550 RepID=A0A8S3PRX3_MYTED|nr:unnamed protein product [Mytilus edulis]